MKVQPVGQKLTVSRTAAKQVKQPAFTGAYNVGEEIEKILPKSIKSMKKLDWLRGEIGGILITALGTGLVAPIFIGFNPFVRPKKGATEEEKKEVSNTKKYTAMRQPISAVLAILFQVSVLKPIDILLDTVANKKNWSKKLFLHVDQCELNSKGYVQRKNKNAISQELAAQGLEKPSWFKGFTEGFKSVKERRNAYDEAFNSKIKDIMDGQLDKLATDFQNTGKIRIGERSLDNPTLAQLINDQIDTYVKDAERLKIDNDGLSYYTKRAKSLMKHENRLKELFKELPLDEIKTTKDEGKLSKLYEQTEETLKKLIEKEKNPEVKELLEDILSKPANLRANRVSRTLERIQKIKDMCGGKYTSEAYLKALSARNTEVDRMVVRLKLNKISEEGIKNATTESVNKVIKNIAEACKFEEENAIARSITRGTDTFDSNLNKLVQKVYKDVTKGYKTMVGNKYKSLSQVIKVLIGVCITLPITCNALNWVYPRFMEIFFPDLSGVKTKKSENNVGGENNG